MYGQDVACENYLRGVQESGEDGKVAFTTRTSGSVADGIAISLNVGV